MPPSTAPRPLCGQHQLLEAIQGWFMFLDNCLANVFLVWLKLTFGPTLPMGQCFVESIFLNVEIRQKIILDSWEWGLKKLFPKYFLFKIAVQLCSYGQNKYIAGEFGSIYLSSVQKHEPASNVLKHPQSKSINF